MIDISKVETYGWDEAIRGMRNSWNSWEKSDSSNNVKSGGTPIVGDSDLKLMSTLAGTSGSHSKYRRMITVYCDILAPLYWWKEFDTYKVGTVSNSCSTMHTIVSKPFDISDFSTEHLGETSLLYLSDTIAYINHMRELYFEDTNLKAKKDYWWQIIQLLPSSYNQKRTVMLNYEVLGRIYNDRYNHKLDEWKTFCRDFISQLPYAYQLIPESIKTCYD